jgi:hypothetical protein
MKWMCFIWFSCHFIAAQTLEKSFNLAADSFYGLDDFGAVYYGKDDALFKKQGNITQQFYDVQLGDLTEVDIINPLKILLFYRDTQTVVLLDNRLNEKQRISLKELLPARFFNHAKLAGERRFWLHDVDQNRLELYDYINNRSLISTAVLKEKVSNLLTDYNFCHVVSDGFIETYNSYGSKTGIITIDRDHLVGHDFEEIVLIKEQKIMVFKLDDKYRFRESETFTNNISEKEVKSLYLKKGKLYIWSGKRVDIYTINTN